MISNGDMFQPHLKYTLKSAFKLAHHVHDILLRHYFKSVDFSSVLVKGLYQTESYSLHVMQLIRILSTEEYFYFPHLVVWGRYCACEILIANPND